MDDQSFTQRSIPIEWTRVEVSSEMATTQPFDVESWVKQKVRQKYASAGEVPVRIEWKARREVIPGVPELIPNWSPSVESLRGMPTPTHIICQGRPDIPGAVIEYIDVDEGAE